MRILQINSFGNLSTGRIVVDLNKAIVSEGWEGKVAYARNTIDPAVDAIKIGSGFDIKVHGLMTRITDKTGFYSKGATKKLIHNIDSYKPDIIHLHNIHGYYLNIKLLFEYLKAVGIPVIWTLHDCWAYTGHCCYYSMVDCDKWKTGCSNCPQKNAYPASKILDNSELNYTKKKLLFSGVNMHLVAVSQWLANDVKQSYLKNYPLDIIPNGIDLNVFKPTVSNFRKEYNLENKKIVLGVASTWDTRKGLKDFISLSKMLDDRYVVIVVGVNDKEIAGLTPNMIGIKRTNSLQKLAEIYTAADVFFNASVEETFGLPTVEAMACGTPVIVYDSTALPEVVNADCGFVVGKNDIKGVYEILINEKFNEISRKKVCDCAADYDAVKQYQRYIDLYKKIQGNGDAIHFCNNGRRY